jgi:hypothetical protein
MSGQLSDHFNAINTDDAINGSNTGNAGVSGVRCAPVAPAMEPASPSAIDRGTVSRTCRNQGPRVLQVRRNQVSRRRAAASPPHRRRRRDRHRAFQAAIRPAPLRPPLPRRNRPCRNEGPRACSSRTRSAAASHCQPARAAQRRQQPALLQQAEPQLPSSAARQCCRSRRPLVRCRWLLVRARQAGAPLLPALRHSRQRSAAPWSPCKGRRSRGSAGIGPSRRRSTKQHPPERSAGGDSGRAAEPVSSGSACRGSVRRAPVPRCRHPPPAPS